MKFRYTFKQFRTFDHLRAAMITHCGAVKTRTGMRGHCPRPDCKFRHKHTLNCSDRSRVAFCHACLQSVDALQIVMSASGCSYMDACQELSSVLV